MKTRICAAEEVPEVGSYLFTVHDGTGEEEVILVRGEDCGVRAWRNVCLHEDYRLDRGRGAAMRDGEVICPKHGSMYDVCSGHCDNGEAKGTNLIPIEVSVEDGDVYLTDDDFRFLHDGGIEDDDGLPGSSSHLQF